MHADSLIGLSYLFVAASSLVAWRRDSLRATSTAHRSSLLWLFVSITLLVMGLLRLTDFGNAVREAGRRVSTSEGWYDSRRPLQLLAVIALLAGWLGIVVALLRPSQSGRGRRIPIILLMSLLMAIAAIRTISFHYVDTVLHDTQILGTELGDLLELVVLAAIALTAATSTRTRSPTVTSRVIVNDPTSEARS